ncbi:MAG: tyrosine-type recombinase/integrase [Bacteroidetes bacterium]|nr:tyrosine-type recombinase/integrase [Bacteroidota bacterium]
MPKVVTWEVNDVFVYLKTLTPLHSLTLEQITKKTLMLMAILSGQRGQTLHALRKENLRPLGDKLFFSIPDPLKTSRPGRHFSELIFKPFPDDPDVCIVSCITEYVKRTECFRLNKESSQFFVTYGKPHGEAARCSISRWLRDVLRDAGIDVTIFESHSTRSASTSAAKTVTNLDTVLKAGGWSCSSTFTRYYDLKVTPKCDMQDALLKRFQTSV